MPEEVQLHGKEDCMTQNEVKIVEALLRDYERLCDQFIVKPERHEAYVNAMELVARHHEKGEGK